MIVDEVKGAAGGEEGRRVGGGWVVSPLEEAIEEGGRLMVGEGGMEQVGGVGWVEKCPKVFDEGGRERLSNCMEGRRGKHGKIEQDSEKVTMDSTGRRGSVFQSPKQNNRVPKTKHNLDDQREVEEESLASLGEKTP